MVLTRVLLAVMIIAASGILLAIVQSLLDVCISGTFVNCLIYVVCHALWGVWLWNLGRWMMAREGE